MVNKKQQFHQEPTTFHPETIEYKPKPERFNILSKIDAYINSFGHKITDITGPNLTLWRDSLKNYYDLELQALLETIRSKVSSTGLQSGIHVIFHTATSVLENLGTNVAGLKLKGLADNLTRNQSVKDAIDEIAIEILNILYISPERRLLFLIAMTCVSVHNANSTEESLAEVLDVKIDKEVEEKYSDL